MERRASGPAFRPSPVREASPGSTAGHHGIAYGQALAEVLAGELAREPRVVLLGADAPGISSGFSAALAGRFGDGRVRRVTGSASDLLAEALTASTRGLLPCVEAPFFAPCLSSWAGVTGRRPAGRLPPLLLLHTIDSTGSFCAQPLLRAFPDLRVVAASDPFAAQGLLRAALRGDEPILYLAHRGLMETQGELPYGDYVVSPARARVLRHGNDVTLVAYHLTLAHGLAVAGELAEAGVSVEVLDPVSLVPLDEETLLASVRKTGRLVIAEEPGAALGLGAEMASLVCDRAFFELDAPVKRVGMGANRQAGRGGACPPLEPREIREAIASIL